MDNNKPLRTLATLCRLLVLVFFALPAIALQPGQLDTGFNLSDPGYGTSDGFNGPVSFIHEQADGKVLVAGGFNRYRNKDCSPLVRLNSDATLDTTFVPANWYGISSIAVQPDGKILVAQEAGLSRWNSDGSEDTAFSNATGSNTSYSNTNAGFDSYDWLGYWSRGHIHTIALDANGKILVKGQFNYYNGVPNNGLIRLHDSGLLDTSFNPSQNDIGSWHTDSTLKAVQADGKVLLSMNGVLKRLDSTGAADTSFNANVASKLLGNVSKTVVAADGKIYAAGATSKDLTRFNSDGSVDTSFNVSTGLNSTISTFTFQGDGKILIAGIINNTTKLSAARLNADGSLDSSFNANIKNSSISRIIQTSSGRILVGGWMTGYTDRYFVGLNTDGSRDDSYFPPTGSSFNDIINTHAVQPDGKIILGGRFQMNNSETVLNRLTRINADGTPDAAFNARMCGGFTRHDVELATVDTVALQADKKILVGGNFTRFNNVAYGPLMRFNSDGSVDSVFQKTIGNGFIDTYNTFSIRHIAVQTDGKILIGGDSNLGASLVRLQADGTPDNNFNNIVGGLYYGPPNHIQLQPDGKILLGFRTQSAPSNAAMIVMRLNPDGTADTAFNAATSPGFKCNYTGATVSDFSLQADGKILVSGTFTEYNGHPVTHLIRLESNGTLDTNFSNNLGSSINFNVNDSSVLPDGRILIAGDFNSVSGTWINRLAMLNADGTLDTTFNSNLGTAFDRIVKNISVLPDGKIIATGDFVSVNGIGRNRIVRLNADGSVDMGASPNGKIYTAAVQADHKVLVGGDFTTLGASNRNRIARLTETGGLDVSFNPGAGTDNTVYSISLQTDNKALIAGAFTTFDGNSRNRLARLNSNGSLDTDFAPGTGANNTIYTTALQTDNKLLIGGNFTSYNGTAITRLARINSNGSLDTTFNSGSGPNGPVYVAVFKPNGKIMIGGNFTQYNGQPANYIARINSNGSLDTTFHPPSGPNGIIKSILVQSDGNIVLGGDFTTVNGNAHNHLVRLQDDGDDDASFNAGTGTNQSVESISKQTDGKLIIAGKFDDIDGKSHNKIARLHTNGSVDTAFNPGEGANGDISTSQITADGNIVIAGSFVSYNGVPRSNLAKIIGGSPAAGPDTDSDGIEDSLDNCPTAANADQLNSDADPQGNACDDYPTNTCECTDTDGDGIGNNADEDDDADSIQDYVEVILGSDPLNNTSGPEHLTVISFETGIPPGWTAPGSSNANWLTTASAASHLSKSLRAGVIGHSAKSQIQFSANFIGPTFALDLKTSTETNDCFRIYIDGTGRFTQCAIIDWKTVFMPITTGTHTIKLEYLKNGTVTAGSDTVWIDRFSYFDGTDTDNDGTANYADTDDDNDGLPDAMDPIPLSKNFLLNAPYKGSLINEINAAQ